MLICKNCNIEYEDGKKFCKHCGDPLTPKEEPFTTKKKPKKTEEEDSGGKLICPVCKIVYEFGSSCIQCGSPLAHQIRSDVNEEPETALRIKPEEGPAVQASQGIPSQAKEEPITSPNSEVGEKPFPVQSIQEQSTKAPRKKLVCPICGIIYERGDSCVRCGSSLAPQTPSQEKERPKLSEAEAVPMSPPPKVSEDIPKMDLDQDLTLASKEPPPPSPKEQDLGVSQPVKRKKVATSLEELFQDESLDQPSVKKATDPIEKRVSSTKKPKRDYRRLFLEVGGVAVMALAGGYFLWSVFFHLTAKQPELRALPPKETVSQVLPASSSASNPAATATESGGLKSREESSTLSKEAPSTLSLPDDSKTPSTEAREIRSIKALLEHIRQANLQKDIDLFVSCYASDFQNLDARKRATLAYWEKFNYVDLSYDLKDPSIRDETAKARVEWLIKTSAKTGGRPQENRSVLYVTFKKEDGGWRIKEVKIAK
jgi:ketosteroid isomerase-like protein